MRWHLNLGLVATALLMLAMPATAQVSVGDNLNMNLSGNVSFGYNGTYGDTVGSGHGIGVGGQGQLTGSYYNPNFLSFRLQPYYNRSQSNSESQSITDTSGFLGQVDLFRGSHFPGSVFFGKDLNGSGQFAVPGLSGITTHGGGHSYGFTWSELLPGLPSFTATYSATAEHSEVFGAHDENKSTVHVLNLQSLYNIDGFHLDGRFLRQSQDATFPELFGLSSATNTNYASDTLSLQATHKILLNGEWGGLVTHSTYGGDSVSGEQGNNSDGSNTLYYTGVSVNPSSKLSLSFNTNYNTNVYGTLQQQILQAGGGSILQNQQGWSTDALSLNAFAFYTLTSHIALTGNWGRQTLYLPDKTRTVSRYGGSVNFNYAQNFLGSFNFSIGAVDMANEQGNQGGGLNGNINYSRRIHGWEVGAGFNYSQYMETLLATYTTSNYKYDASVRRRFAEGLYWTASFYGNHSGLTRFDGISNRSEGFNTSILYKRYSLNATYNKSGGTSILTTQGLVQVPSGVPPTVLPDLFNYNGKGYGFGGTAIVKRAVWTLSYSKSYGNTLGATTASNFDSRSLNARLQYRLRKVYLNAGFTHFQQEVGLLGSTPINYNTFFVGFSRWFNLF
jgi:hypothetical protein